MRRVVKAGVAVIIGMVVIIEKLFVGSRQERQGLVRIDGVYMLMKRYELCSNIEHIRRRGWIQVRAMVVVVIG